MKAVNIDLSKRFRDPCDLTGESPLREFTEISIPMPWGQIAGKWYGPLDIRPIIGLHGWLDNAGTFDRLAALLPKNLAFLCLDLPGHGLSSHLPEGVFYNLIDNIHILRLILQHFNWHKTAFIVHSMSGAIAYAFSALFPHMVDFVVAIDPMRPFSPQDETYIRMMQYRIEEFLRQHERSKIKSDAPTYTYDELIERHPEGLQQKLSKSVCWHLVARSIAKSDKFSDRYYFARDRRIMFQNDLIGAKSLGLSMLKHIKCPYLFISTVQSYLNSNSHYEEILNEMKKKENFIYMQVDAVHHVHLDQPELLIDTLLKFLIKFATNYFKNDKKPFTKSKL